MPQRILIVLGLLLVLTGCGAVAVERPPSQAAVYSYGPYVLRTNDRVRVQVYDDQNITGEYLIDSAGFISIPLGGRIRAAGLTSTQLEQALTSRLSDGILKKPGVNVQILAYAPFYIHGEVKRGGEFPYKPGLTILDAVASAGGFTYRADETRAYVRRAGTDVESAYTLNTRVPIFPGDNVRIPERFF